MKKLILTTLAISGLLMAIGVVSTISVSTNGKALAKEVELRHGADDAPQVNDDRGRGGHGKDDLARRGEKEVEHGVEVENQVEKQG